MLEHTKDVKNTLIDTPQPAGEAREAPESQDQYVVHLPLYDGPIDLLLHLIEKRQLEISTISLVAVTGQYLAYLQRYEAQMSRAALSLSQLAEFVSVAARLLLIKAQSLLPAATRESAETGIESAVTIAEELQRHLVEYKAAKDIARLLDERARSGLQSYGRSRLLADIEAQLAWVPPTLSGLNAQILGQTFQRLLELSVQREPGGRELLPVARVRVSERIAEIRAHLEQVPSVLLSDILAHESSRLVHIVTFIAILELWKWQRIDIAQEEPMGPIILSCGALWHETWQELVDD